jgi:hypothetical protein
MVLGYLTTKITVTTVGETIGRICSHCGQNYYFAMKALLGTESKKEYKELVNFIL